MKAVSLLALAATLCLSAWILSRDGEEEIPPTQNSRDLVAGGASRASMDPAPPPRPQPAPEAIQARPFDPERDGAALVRVSRQDGASATGARVLAVVDEELKAITSVSSTGFAPLPATGEAADVIVAIPGLPLLSTRVILQEREHAITVPAGTSVAGVATLDGKPCPGVAFTVECFGGALPRLPRAAWRALAETHPDPIGVRVRTGDDGRFRVGGLPEGWRGKLWCPLTFVFTDGNRHHDVTEPREDLELALRPKAVVRGRVLDGKTLEPLRGAVIKEPAAGGTALHAVSGPDGRFEGAVSLAAPGACLLRYFSEANQQHRITSCHVAPGSLTDVGDVRLLPETTYSLRVNGPGGESISSVLAALEDHAEAPTPLTCLSADQLVRVTAWPGAPILIGAAGYCVRRLQLTEPSDVILEVSLARDCRITVHARASAGPVLDELSVTMARPRTPSDDPTSLALRPDFFVEHDSRLRAKIIGRKLVGDGAIEAVVTPDKPETIPALLSGAFDLSLFGPEKELLAQATVHLQEGEQRDVVLVIPEATSVEGFVRDRDGSPVEGATVTVQVGAVEGLDPSLPVAHFARLERVSTDARGWFRTLPFHGSTISLDVKAPGFIPHRDAHFRRPSGGSATIVLERGRSLHVIAVTPEGRPVRFRDARLLRGGEPISPARAWTAEGLRFDGLPEEALSVEVSFLGRCFRWELGDEAELRVPITTLGFVDLQKCGNVSFIYAVPSDPDADTRQWIDREGIYELMNPLRGLDLIALPPGRWRILLRGERPDGMMDSGEGMAEVRAGATVEPELKRRGDR